MSQKATKGLGTLTPETDCDQTAMSLPPVCTPLHCCQCWLWLVLRFVPSLNFIEYSLRRFARSIISWLNHRSFGSGSFVYFIARQDHQWNKLICLQTITRASMLTSYICRWDKRWPRYINIWGANINSTSRPSTSLQRLIRLDRFYVWRVFCIETSASSGRT
jgi:hypothetical protein